MDKKSWHDLGPAENFRKAPVTEVSAGNTKLAITWQDGKFGAVSGICNHAGGPLGQGAIEGKRLVCPWHGREYDPETGECDGYAESATAYPVEVRDDGVYVRVE